MKKRLLALTLALAFALTGCATGTAEEKSFTLQVIHGDGSAFETTVDTDKATVGEALLDAGLVEGDQGPYGLYVTTVDGETADEAAEEWWCLTKGGGSVNTGVDSTAIEPGATYEFTLMTGY